MHTLVLIPLLALTAAAVPSLSSDKPLATIPEYDVAFAHADAARSESSSTINKRTDFSGAKITCDNKGFYACPLDIYDEQLSYLRKLHGQPRMDPGPDACSRVSCERNWGVVICNHAGPASPDSRRSMLTAFSSLGRKRPSSLGLLSSTG